ncbi:hypothetical protein AQY21_06475 [Paracoccus sp. MKU1]|nr:hypothetical protein AQY21_06475 [Paracoccus sp. MKU1]
MGDKRTSEAGSMALRETCQVARTGRTTIPLWPLVMMKGHFPRPARDNEAMRPIPAPLCPALGGRLLVRAGMACATAPHR